MRIKKGDTVKVLKGKDAGRTAKVLRLLPKEGQLVVDGVNIWKKHQKAAGQKKPGGIVELIQPVKISNVMLVCPECKVPTRVGIKRVKGKKTRMCKRCQKAL